MLVCPRGGGSCGHRGSASIVGFFLLGQGMAEEEGDAAADEDGEGDSEQREEEEVKRRLAVRASPPQAPTSPPPDPTRHSYSSLIWPWSSPSPSLSSRTGATAW